MHVVVAWHVRARGSAAREAVTAEIEAVLAAHDSIAILPTLHIVPVASPNERLLLRRALVDVARARPSELHLVISPVIEGGTYAGWLPKSLWPQINEKTDGGPAT